jgi:xanthine dehydrogenase YagR molybdenum-binding subunit
VKVELEPLPFVVDPDEAARPDAPQVFPGPADMSGTAGGGGGGQGLPQAGNVRGPLRKGNGDVEAALAASDVVVDRTYRTRVQTHSAMETHGVVAEWSDQGLTVWSSTQGTLSVRDELATALGLPRARVRVITEFMGGGFGAKFGAGNYGLVAALLARKAGAPVRLMLDRAEEHVVGGNRPDSVQRLRLGAKKDGTLTALHLVSHGTGGTGTGAGTAGPAQNLYPAPAFLTEEHDVFTNAGPAAAFRAPGHPQGCFALEQAVDELAERLGMDPLALRDVIDVDTPMMIDSATRRVERRVGAERIGWARRHAPRADAGPVKRGLGFAQGIWYRLTSFDSACEVRVWRDGAVEVRSAVQDIGGGIKTALAQVVAEELGIDVASIIVKIGDTDEPPGPASGGSVTTGSITPAARDAAHRVRRHIIEAAAMTLGVPPGEVQAQRGAFTGGGKTATFAQACGALTMEPIAERAKRAFEYGTQEQGGGRRRMGVESLGGAQFVEVEVDTETGVVRVVKVVAVHDCGRPINPLAVESQVNGGVLQGISYALLEERVMDRGSGRMLNPNLDQYKIVGARETPAIEVVLLEDYKGRSSTDAAGIGEPATVPTAAAIANAVYNATGVRVLELPMTPARVLAALARRSS